MAATHTRALRRRDRHGLRQGICRGARGAVLTLLCATIACGGGGGGESGSIGGLVTANGAAKVLAKVIVTLPSTTMLVGEVMNATAQGYDQFGAPMPIGAPTWTTGAPAIATIAASGQIAAGTPGSTSVTANVGGVQGSTPLIVLVVPVARVLLSPALAPLAVGATQQLVAEVRDTRGNVVTGHDPVWTTSAPGIATVSTTGMVTALATGTATVTATSDGVSATTLVTVTTRVTPVARVAVSPAAVTVALGQTVQFSASLQDSAGTALSGRPVVWTSSDRSVASVTATGFVTPLSAGAAQITATSEGKSATAALTVNDIVSVEIMNPYAGQVSDDTLYVACVVRSQATVALVVGAVGWHRDTLVYTAIGALKGAWVWVAHINIADMYWGDNLLSVTATDVNGASGTTTLTFIHDPSNPGGGILPDKKSKSFVPAVKPKIP